MRRIERLVNLIAALLETRRPMTADEIRDRIAGYDQSSFEAFRRAFERDKEALRAMGIPLEVRPTDPFAEQPDGYIIPKTRYYLPQLDLEPDELAALRLAAEAVLGTGSEAEAGYLKLAVDAPLDPATGPRVVWGADVAAEQPLLGPLYSALLDKKAVSFEYETASGEVGTRTVEGYGLVHRRGHWYLVGRDADRDDVRSFKVSRVRGPVRTLDQAYAVSPSFDASAHLSGEAWEIGERVTTATVRFEPSMRWWAEHNLGDLPAREADGGALDVELPVSNPDALVSWVLGFGDGVEVRSPPEARRHLFAHLSTFLDDPASSSRRDRAVTRRLDRTEAGR